MEPHSKVTTVIPLINYDCYHLRLTKYFGKYKYIETEAQLSNVKGNFHSHLNSLCAIEFNYASRKNIMKDFIEMFTQFQLIPSS